MLPVLNNMSTHGLKRTPSCVNFFDLLIRSCVHHLRSDETSLAERDAIMSIDYEGTQQKSFENALGTAIKNPKFLRYAEETIPQFHYHKNLLPFMFSLDTISNSDEIIIAYCNVLLLKIVNQQVHKSGKLTYVDLECVQNIIHSLEFNPPSRELIFPTSIIAGDSNCMSDSERRTDSLLPRHHLKRPVSNNGLLPNCCTVTENFELPNRFRREREKRDDKEGTDLSRGTYIYHPATAIKDVHLKAIIALLVNVWFIVTTVVVVSIVILTSSISFASYPLEK